MEKVVYLLGAGFSAPLGLPVMANFLVKSKDLFAAEPAKYRHFEEIFSTIGNLHVCKSYFEADLFNIEEILSILEMREGLERSADRRSFVNYVKDVVQYYTPRPIPPPRQAPPNWLNSIFGQGPWAHCAAFVASLFNLRCSVQWPNPGGPGVITFARVENPRVEYSVVTLNYDLILEDVCSFLNQHHPSQKTMVFKKDFTAPDNGNALTVPLAKLHGSVDSLEIIAPTWNKSLYPPITPAWRKAHELFEQANHIRILGYSLPTADAYIKYLLKSAAAGSQNLKSIDVLCKGALAKKNFDEFVKFNFYRFKQTNLEDYVRANYQTAMDLQHFGTERRFDILERVHESFMAS
jgi:hypothetical protein